MKTRKVTKERKKTRQYYEELDEMFRNAEYEERPDPQRLYRQAVYSDREYIQQSIRINY